MRNEDGLRNDGWPSKEVPAEMKRYTKFANKDPHPHIPFVTPERPLMTKAEAFLYGAAGGFTIGALVLTEWAR